MDTNSGEDRNSQNKESNGQDRNNKKVWPFSSQETFVGVVAVLIIVCWVGLPIWSATQFIRNGSTSTADTWTPLLSVFVALTTLTVSAIFLFMTFRIDRGAKFEARAEAKEAVEKIAEEATKEAAEESARKVTAKAREATAKAREATAKAREAITEVKKEVEEKARETITEIKKEVEQKAAEATEKIENKVKKVDGDQNEALKRINELTDENIRKRIEAGLQNRDIDILESIIKQAEEEMRKQRTHSDNDSRDGWGWLRRCRKWLRGHIRRNDENR